MNVLQRNEQICDRNVAGNKAATLAELANAGFDVPPFFVIEFNDSPAKSIGAALQGEIDLAINAICKNRGRLAVRSSSREEDGQQLSFAGQFDTFLNVEPAEVPAFAAKVARSGRGDHIDTYRRSNGATAEEMTPSVLVQRMVDADTAGVAFAADPISGDRAVAVVAATSGTGESLVSGDDQGDTWRIDVTEKIRRRELQGDKPVLNDRQILQIAALVRSVSDHAGKPQDIEWAFEGKRLFLLQSRDITALGNGQSSGSYALWDNSNIVESYGGVTTPLTFSVARSAYQEAYRHMGRALGVSERAIAQNERAYEQMIGLIQGRVYYNLLNWYRLLMLTPGFRFNKRFMEQMMGVTEGLPEDAIPTPEDDRPLAGLFAMAGIIRVSRRLISKLFGHNSRVRRFHDDINGYLEPVDLPTLSLDQLIDTYEALQAKVIPAWDTPLLNDLYCMIFHGALRHLSERWLGEDLAEIHNDLVSGESGIISVEPVRQMKQLAVIAAGDKRFVTALCEKDLSAIEFHIRKHPAFQVAFDKYVARFGDRCLDELKLESATLKDNPMPLLRGIGQLACSGVCFADTESSDLLRTQAESRVARRLEERTLRRFIYNAVLKLARARVRDRENLRFERTRVYGRVRAIFVEIGKRLAELKVLGETEDIFYLDVGEITGIIRGTGISASLCDIVDNRKREFSTYRNSDDPPRRFITKGPPQLASSMQAVDVDETELSNEHRSGQACSQGIVRGPVRIVQDPRDTDFKSGEILVAQRTDPGWVTIFPLVSGMIMERGSLLSHSAIVARELGIPAVVGVDNACRWLADGDWVELNGATGMIRRIDMAERAA